jgi:hypothetical protein
MKFNKKVKYLKKKTQNLFVFEKKNTNCSLWQQKKAKVVADL